MHPLSKWRFFVIIILSLGIFFRCINLDQKVYWHDEVYTRWRLAGYTASELEPLIFNGKILSIENIQKYQRLNPDKHLTDTLHSLAVDDPQHPPLYYIIARTWVNWLGDSITTLRSLSVFLSLLIFPAVYGLCLELFASPRVAWITVSLVAISPFHVLYSQECREYVLWTVTILGSSWALLRAIRLTTSNLSSIQNAGNWGLYGLTLALGFYTFILTGLVAIGHGIYLLILEKFRLTKIIKYYLLSSLLGVLAFIPWVLVLIQNYHQFQVTTAWMQFIKISRWELLQNWGFNISRIFVDVSLSLHHPIAIFIQGLALTLFGYSLYFLYQRTSPRIWLFVFSLIGVPGLFLWGQDLIFGGIRSLSGRYLIPCLLGIHLATAYLLATQLESRHFYQKKFWSGVAVTIFLAGIISCSINSQINTSWIKVVSYSLPKVALIINAKHQPLMISDNVGYNAGNIVALSYRLKPQTKFMLFSAENISAIPHQFSDVFVLSFSEDLKAKLEKNQAFQSRLVFQDDYIQLWQLF